MLDDTALADLAELDRDVTDDEDLPEKGQSVRDSIEKAWEDHGGELPEERKEARERRRDEKDNNASRVARDNGKESREARGRDSREAPKRSGDPAKLIPSSTGEQSLASTPAIAPPTSWSAEAKAVWNKLHPSVQAAVNKRETEFENGRRQITERYGGIHRLTQALAPRFQRYNLSPDRGFANMASWFEAIENNPAAGIRELAKLYKVDLGQPGAAAPAQAQGAPNGTQAIDPRIVRSLQDLYQWRQNLEQTRSTEVQNAKLSAWSPNKPHFAEVRSLMGDLLENAVRNQDPRFLNEAQTDVDLDKLYKAAIQVHPELGVLEIKQAWEQEQREHGARVAQARRAGSSIRPGSPGSAPLKGEAPKKLPKGSSVRAHLQAAWDEARST
jgi:hypothetical protein